MNTYAEFGSAARRFLAICEIDGRGTYVPPGRAQVNCPHFRCHLQLVNRGSSWFAQLTCQW